MTKFDNDTINDSAEAPYLKLFSSATTNGRKVTIFLELLKVPYIFRNIKDFRTETKEPWFLELNPVAKIPLISEVNSKGEIFNLSESGAILNYLAQKYDTENKFSYSVNDQRHYEELEFLFFHASNLDVSQNKFNFTKTEESKKALIANYELFNNQLKKNNTGYLVGDHFSLAEAISLAHVDQLYKNIDTESVAHLTELRKWYDNLINLPEVQIAFHKTD